MNEEEQAIEVVDGEMRPHERLVAELREEDAAFDIEGMNRRMLAELEALGALPPSVVFAGMAAALEDGLLFIADAVVASLSIIGVLPQGYETTMQRIAVGVENIRLRSLYDAALTFHAPTSEKSRVQDEPRDDDREWC